MKCNLELNFIYISPNKMVAKTCTQEQCEFCWDSYEIVSPGMKFLKLESKNMLQQCGKLEFYEMQPGAEFYLHFGPIKW
jgi:hypothetical protein